MAASVEHVVKVLQNFQICTKDVFNFVLPQQILRKPICQLTKNLYDLDNSADRTTKDITSLPRLITKNFDDEQIWQQLELNNGSTIPTLLERVSKAAVKGTTNITLGISTTSQDLEKDDGEDDEFQSSDDDDMSWTDDEISFKKGSLKEYSKLKSKLPKKKPHEQKSEVEDQFFNLSELEKFLKKEDEKEEKRNQNVESSDESSSDVDYFEDIESDEGDSKSKKLKNARYKDFFDPPLGENVEDGDSGKDQDSSGESEEQEEDPEEHSDMEYDTRDVEDEKPPSAEELWSSRPRDLLPASDSEKSEMSDSENEISGQNVKSSSSPMDKGKSTFEKQQAKLKEKISQLEDLNLSDKPWQLKGEVTAESRPENSLLEEHLQFDHLVRQAPLITEEKTKTLEEIILQRIKDKAWDDVERKVKPKEAPFEYKRRVTLDQEKSKMSLAEIYEKEYITKQQNDKGEKQVPEHTKIKEAMTELFRKLDALSNFHYIPKALSSEIKLVNNLPAISVEEVAPVNVSEAGLLAPEEVKDKLKGDLKGQTERSSTDRKRERRAKKVFQRKFHAAKEAKKNKLKPSLQTKYSKENVEKQKKERKGISADDQKRKVKSFSSSSTFFEKLQDQVHSQVQSHMKKKPVIDKKSTKLKL